MVEIKKELLRKRFLVVSSLGMTLGIVLFIIPIFLACTKFTPEPEIYEPNYSPDINVFGLISNVDDLRLLL